ncbi:MAG: diguanylate cyclase [Planctomycetota bacterium]
MSPQTEHNPNGGLPQIDEPAEVLVIDDSAVVLRLLHARLRNEHVNLTLCDSAPDGLEIAREKKPALILLDLEMPGLDGYEVLRALKDSPETINIPVIVLSGLNNPQDKVTAFDLGAMDYITKPFESHELRARVRSALRIHHLLSMLSQRARIDGLTGLWNRMYFDEQFDGALNTARRHGRAISLAMVDVDHFKSLNDNYGHPAGDEVIRRVARLLQGMGRSSDLACRYGGEEFAVIMPETAPQDAARLCDRFREALRAISWPAHPERQVTASVGIAGAANAGSMSTDQWVKFADEALYQAKETGRDRVIVNDLNGEGQPLPYSQAG